MVGAFVGRVVDKLAHMLYNGSGRGVAQLVEQGDLPHLSQVRALPPFLILPPVASANRKVAGREV